MIPKVTPLSQNSHLAIRCTSLLLRTSVPLSQAQLISYQKRMRNANAENTMGTRIREMRKAAGMSQEQLAEILCTKKATISAYENDHIDIKSSIVLEIAKALNCSGSYLLEGKKAEALDARIMDALLELKMTR